LRVSSPIEFEAVTKLLLQDRVKISVDIVVKGRDYRGYGKLINVRSTVEERPFRACPEQRTVWGPSVLAETWVE
jgi:hypothetical protein